MTFAFVLAGVAAVLAVIGLVMRAIARTASVPSQGDPQQVTPPIARDTRESAPTASDRGAAGGSP